MDEIVYLKNHSCATKLEAIRKLTFELKATLDEKETLLKQLTQHFKTKGTLGPHEIPYLSRLIFT
mgnify:CR=1 FL=1